MNKHNLRMKKIADKRREAIRALRAKNWEWPEIGRKYGISPQRAQQLGKVK